jgi:hypothetical protein
MDKDDLTVEAAMLLIVAGVEEAIAGTTLYLARCERLGVAPDRAYVDLHQGLVAALADYRRDDR